jgi:hypothetical protein
MGDHGTSGDWFDLITFTPIGDHSDIESQPLAAIFTDNNTDTSYGRKTHTGAFRTCWLCENATWAGKRYSSLSRESR